MVTNGTRRALLAAAQIDLHPLGQSLMRCIATDQDIIYDYYIEKILIINIIRL